MFDAIVFFAQFTTYLFKLFVQTPIFSVSILFLLAYGLTKKSIRTTHTNTRRSTSDLHCHCCGDSMLESDIFCQSCQKITPKVQEMLKRNIDKKPDYYRDIDNGYKMRCPHCRALYRSSKALFPPERYGSSIKYCGSCHNYFLDDMYTEWSVSSHYIKFIEFFPLGFLIIFISFIFFIIGSIAYGDWLMAREFTVLLIVILSIRSAYVLVQHKIINKKIFHNSNMRLKQNPDYPQILADMGYGRYMNKKYHHLRKDKPTTIKDFLKDAFTFD